MSIPTPTIKSSTFSILLKGLLSHDVPAISAQDFINNPGDFLLLDTRSKKEFLVSHIPGAIWVGYEEFELKHIRDVPKEKQVIVYCSVGYRSEKIGKKLLHLGYPKVTNLYGGIFEYVNLGGELQNEQGEATSRLHAYNKLWGIWTDAEEKVYP